MAAALSLLQIIQEESRRQNLPVPSAITSSTDEQVLQMWGLMNEGITALAARGDWGYMVATKQFTHRNDADYAALYLDTDLPDYKWMVPGTLWNLTTRLPVPLTTNEEAWWSSVNLAVQPAAFYARVYAQKLHIYPADVTQQFKFEYMSEYPVWSSDKLTRKFSFQADSDIPALPTRLIQADLRWRWRAAKGFSYAEQFRELNDMVVDDLAKNCVPGELNLAGGGGNRRMVGPGLLIAAGSWPL